MIIKEENEKHLNVKNFLFIIFILSIIIISMCLSFSDANKDKIGNSIRDINNEMRKEDYKGDKKVKAQGIFSSDYILTKEKNGIFLVNESEDINMDICIHAKRITVSDENKDIGFYKNLIVFCKNLNSNKMKMNVPFKS